jgi:acetyltransferase-like isoleucine patch superfamily enzyme
VPRAIPGDWCADGVPDNVAVHPSAYVETSASFASFRSTLPEAMQIGEGAAAYAGCQFDVGAGGKVTIGRYALLNACLITADELVVIGDYAMIGWLVSIADSEIVPMDVQSRRAALVRAASGADRRIPRSAPPQPVRIGPNTWIGFESCIAPGVTVGEGSIVGARSVVLESVPPYCIAAGNPAQIIRRLPCAEADHG